MRFLVAPRPEVPDKEQSVGKTIAAESVKDVLAMFPDEGRPQSTGLEQDAVARLPQ